MVRAVAPSVFGYEVATTCPLRFLRAGGGAERLEIAVAPEPRRPPEFAPMYEWELSGADPNAPPRATLYRTERGYEFWATDAGGYRVDLIDGRIEIPHDGDAILREQRLWGVPTILTFMHRGELPLHAAAVEVGKGRSVILAAPQKFGKTTLAMAFHQHGYRVLSEDIVCCRLGTTPTLLPGPALLRIRPDVFSGAAPPGTHVIIARPDRVFLGLDEDRKGESGPVPLAGVVFLRESAAAVRLERARNQVTLQDLWALSFKLQNDEGRRRSFHQLAQLAGAVPAWDLFRPLTLESLQPTVEAIVKHFDT